MPFIEYLLSASKYYKQRNDAVNKSETFRLFKSRTSSVKPTKLQLSHLWRFNPINGGNEIVLEYLDAFTQQNRNFFDRNKILFTKKIRTHHRPTDRKVEKLLFFCEGGKKHIE